MLSVMQTMELTKKLMDRGISNTTGWIASHTLEQQIAYLDNPTQVDLQLLHSTEIYHGTPKLFEYPDSKYFKKNKDFGPAFYCTQIYKQAHRWATRRNETGYINYYKFQLPTETLKTLKFNICSYDWLDFIATCRHGNTHSYDIVEGPMADDEIYNYVELYLSGEISADDFMTLAKFKHPTHQVVFCTERALALIKFIRREEC